MPQASLQSFEVLRCPTADSGHLAAGIRRRGNLPLEFGADCVLELTPQDIRANWKAAKAMKRDVAGAVAAELSFRLSRCNEDEDDSASHAGEAAACLFLSLHHQGMALDAAMSGCRVLWDARHHTEQVERLA